MENWNKASRSITFDAIVKYEKLAADPIAQTPKKALKKSLKRNR